MLVYRVETVGDRFKGRPSGVLWRHQVGGWGHLPCPHDDGVPDRWYKDKKNVCATKSVEEFKLWWKGIRGLKKIKRARVAVLDVPDKHVMVGRTQVVINREKARIVGTLTTRYTVKLHKPLKHTKL